MENSEAFDALVSDDVPERLDAARHLATAATRADLPQLRRFAFSEPDELVARVLRRRVAELSPKRDSKDSGLRPDDEVLQRERARARREAIAMFLHEVTPLVGDVEIVASSQLEDYAGGAVERAIERVRTVLSAFEDLRTAAGPGVPQELNLTEHVTGVVRQEVARCGNATLRDPDNVLDDDLSPESELFLGTSIDVVLARNDPVVTFGAPGLLTLILSNALRNAFESCQSCGSDYQPRVVIGWGATDVDAWVSVIDNCAGLPMSEIWSAGVTSKEGEHRGMGLVIVRQAVESIGGAVTLRDNTTAPGVAFELRWPLHKAGS